MKVKIENKAEQFEPDEVLRKKVKPYGHRGAHVTVPVKHIEKDAIVLIKQRTKK